MTGFDLDTVVGQRDAVMEALDIGHRLLGDIQNSVNVSRAGHCDWFTPGETSEVLRGLVNDMFVVRDVTYGSIEFRIVRNSEGEPLYKWA